MILGEVKAISKAGGLLLNLPQGHVGRVALVNISDSYHDNPTDAYKVGQVLKCCLLKCAPKKHGECALSFRESR